MNKKKEGFYMKSIGRLAAAFTACLAAGALVFSAAAESTVTLNFDDSLKVATVGKEANNTAAADVVEMKDGVFHFTASNGPGMVSLVLNQNTFAADEDVEITFDYKGLNRSWSDDRILIGAKGDKQWGSLVLRLPNTAEGSKTLICLKDDLATELGSAGSAPLEANVLYHFRIKLAKAAGKMEIFVTKEGETEASSPLLTVTNDLVKTLSGGLAFGQWATEFTIDNAKIVAGGRVLMDADFSTLPENAAYEDSEGTAIITGGALYLHGWKADHSAGSYVVTKGLLGMDDLTSFDMTYAYRPADVAWSIDKLIMGYKGNGKEQDSLVLELMGNEQQAKLVKYTGAERTELKTVDLILEKDVTYIVKTAVDTDAGKADITVYPASGAVPAEPTISVTDDFIKTVKGDIGFTSFGGSYAVDDIVITSKEAEIPTPTTKPAATTTKGTPSTGDGFPIAMALTAGGAALLTAAALLLNKKRGAHNR